MESQNKQVVNEVSCKNTVPVKVEDCLDQDPPIRGQKYACMSFISPEDVLRNKEIFFLSSFLKHFSDDVTTMFENIIAAFPENKEVRDMVHNVAERHVYIKSDEQLGKEFTYFKDTNADTLESKFYEDNNFQTSIRGIKIRGVYESIKEAQMRAQAIKKFDGNFDVFIGEVGCWCPWSPDPSSITEQEFAEEQLNTLMKKYKENQNIKDEMYASRKDYLVEQNKKPSSEVMSGSTSEPPPVPVPVLIGASEGSVSLCEDVDPWLQQKENV